MRSLLPALLTLPSSTVATFSCWPMLRMSSVFPLNTKDEVRAGTRNPLTWESAVHKSSVIPSLRYSFSLSELMFTKGSTATDFVPSGAAGVCRDIFGCNTKIHPAAAASSPMVAAAIESKLLCADVDLLRRRAVLFPTAVQYEIHPSEYGC